MERDALLDNDLGLMTQSQSQTQPQSQRPTQQRTKKKLELKHGVSMKVTGCGPMDQSNDIKLRMEWTVPSRELVNKEIVISTEDATSRKAKDIVWRMLNCPVFLNTDDQIRDFPRFLGISMDEFEATKFEAGQTSSTKPIKEFGCVDLLPIWEGSQVHVYLITGRRDVFLLGEDQTEWAYKLSEQEIEQDIPFEIFWTGEETNYETNSKRTTELVFKIISYMNGTQDEEFWSLPLFSLCSSIAAYLYPIKLKRVKTFSTTMTISGEGYSTGKSLLYDVCMLALYGKQLEGSSPNTVARLFEMLSNGTPIYLREWSDDLWKILIESIKAVWEANGKTVNKVKRVPRTTMFVSANLTVKEVEKKLPKAVRSKVCLLYTGEKSLQHDNLSEFCSGMVEAARELHKFLPSLVGLGVLTMLNKIETPQVAAYNGELRNDNDDREAQILHEYDGVYGHLSSKGSEHNLDLPPLFQKTFTDHGCVTGRHKSTEDIKLNMSRFLKFLDDASLYELLVPSCSGKVKGYRVNPNDPRISKEAKFALNSCTQSFITSEGGKGVRRRFLNPEQLEPDVAKQLEAKVLHTYNTYQSWLERRVLQIEKQNKKVGDQFRKCFFRLRPIRSNPDTQLGSSALEPSSTVADTPSIAQAASTTEGMESTNAEDEDPFPSLLTLPVSDAEDPGPGGSKTNFCHVSGCISSGRAFSTLQYYRRHLNTVGHKYAVAAAAAATAKFVKVGDVKRLRKK